MYRLRQVIEEKVSIEETLTAFELIISNLKKRPRLSSEQEASLILFEIAQEETKVNKSEIYEEEKKLEHYFHISTGHSLKEIIPYLPKYPKTWPSLASVHTNETLSVNTKRLKALSEVALTELNIQKSEAWPNMKIGPSIAIEKEGTNQNKMIGLNIQIPLPVFHLNGAGKAHARSKLLKAQKYMSLSVSEETHERFEQFKVYTSTVRTLKKTMKKKLIENKHTKIKEMYLRGVIASSLFLDSLRQKNNYLKNRNNREMVALRALWNIYKYDGTILKENI